jgi:DNA primase catalytic subunit
MVGISARRLALTVNQFRAQLVLLFALFLAAALLIAHLVARSLSISLSKVSEAIGSLPAEGLEAVPLKDPVFTDLIERVRSATSSYADSLKELETQKLLLEADLTRLEEENALLNSRVNTLLKQTAHHQEKMKVAETQSQELDKLGALIQFATTIVAEVESSMRHIGQGAQHLHQHLSQLTGLVDQLEKSVLHSAEESEQVRKYKESIGYETVKQSVDELVATIQGGAGWAEQLVDLLRQLAASSTTKGR